jgi:hypothetical protein
MYPAMSYHRYDVVNHMDVDERLGGWAAFVALRDALRRAGMRLVLDVVLYHVGLRNPLFPEGPFILQSPELTRLVKEAASDCRGISLGSWRGASRPTRLF